MCRRVTEPQLNERGTPVIGALIGARAVQSLSFGEIDGSGSRNGERRLKERHDEMLRA
jgi:hypothetical protein